MINEIIQGDCLEVMKGIPNNVIDLTVTSPPYDNLRDYKGYDFNFEAIAKELYRITHEGGVVVWVVGDATVNGSETGTSFKQALYFKEIGFNLHDTMIWNKMGFSAVGALKTRYSPVFEYMFILTAGKIKTFNPIKDKRNVRIRNRQSGTIRQKNGSFKQMSSPNRASYEYGQRYNIWEIFCCNSSKDRNEHPAPFPEDLARDHILSWSNEGDTVLDPMCGSGTTCKMAYRYKRKYIGIEISEEYCAIAEKRLKEEKLQIRMDI